VCEHIAVAIAGRVVALACLASLLAGEGLGLFRIPWRARLEAVLGAASQTFEQRRIGDSRLLFDPDYGPFLQAVCDATPPGSTITLLAPKTSELYTYQASYLLAPRGLLPPERLADADYAAVYGPGSVPGERIPLPVSKGALFRLR
jgi:hypothetical protein